MAVPQNASPLFTSFRSCLTGASGLVTSLSRREITLAIELVSQVNMELAKQLDSQLANQQRRPMINQQPYIVQQPQVNMIDIDNGVQHINNNNNNEALEEEDWQDEETEIPVLKPKVKVKSNPKPKIKKKKVTKLILKPLKANKLKKVAKGRIKRRKFMPRPRVSGSGSADAVVFNLISENLNLENRELHALLPRHSQMSPSYFTYYCNCAKNLLGCPTQNFQGFEMFQWMIDVVRDNPVMNYESMRDCWNAEHPNEPFHSSFLWKVFRRVILAYGRLHPPQGEQDVSLESLQEEPSDPGFENLDETAAISEAELMVAAESLPVDSSEMIDLPPDESDVVLPASEPSP